MKVKLLTYNNRAGIVIDAMLLQNLIQKNVTENADILFIEHMGKNWAVPNYVADETGDVGIWIQNPRYDYLQNFKKNIWFVNEEWAGADDLKKIDQFDYIVVKTEYARKLLEPIRPDVVCLPLLSYDFYDPAIAREQKFLHFNGRAIQKNTEAIMRQKVPITVVDTTKRFVTPSNVEYITQYMIKRDIKKMLNRHSVHICPSLYESWGHYLYEGLSTGAEIICSDIPSFSEHLDPSLVRIIPTVEKIDLDYHYCKDNLPGSFPLRKAFFLDEEKLTNVLENFEPIGREQERRDMFHDIMLKNSNRLIDFFKNI